jgi:hypothetical protein
VNCSLALVLLLQISLVEETQMEAELNRINPNEARVLAAAKSPESLWALIIDPSTRCDDRMRAAEMASEILPPRYMAILTAARLELEWQPPPEPMDDPTTLAELRRTPWPWQVQKMRDSPDEPFPYTAFLALAKRIDEEPLAEGNECGAAYDAARLVQVLDHPPVEEAPPFGTMDGCRTWLREFHDWLQSHRAELEAGAAAEFTAIADARARMNQVSLCRP